MTDEGDLFFLVRCVMFLEYGFGWTFPVLKLFLLVSLVFPPLSIWGLLRS